MSTSTAQAPTPEKQHPQTGPRSTDGKARSAQNSLKHGLTSAAPHITHEERPDYEALEAALRNKIKPAGPVEEIIFQQILANAWNLHRITRFEAAETDPDKLAKLQRYRTAAERGYYRGLKEIRESQTSTVLMESYRDLPIELPPMADPRELAKRKHAKAGNSLAQQWVLEQERQAAFEHADFQRRWVEYQAKTKTA